MIEVRRLAGDDRFAVAVREGTGETRHEIVASAAALARLAPGARAEAAVEATFRFLLEREPKEAILSRFDIAVVSRYFPEYELELPRYVAALDP